MEGRKELDRKCNFRHVIRTESADLNIANQVYADP